MNISKAALCAAVFAYGYADTTVHAASGPDAHAPIGVMGDHLHKQGEVMFSYRMMHMSMRGNRDGSSDIDPTEIVTTEANPFANPPVMPPTLRVVPLDMQMRMHMLGVMYAPTDAVTLMGMLNYMDMEMDHRTFAGPMGTNVRGEFTTSSKGVGDASLSALIRLLDNGSARWHATVGFSLPFGDIEETDQILTPMNTRPTVRLPYPMQLGSGSYDLITGVTGASGAGKWGWGGQWRSVWRIQDNDEDYRLGDQHQLTGWLSYLVNDGISLSTRLTAHRRGNLRGMDPRIMAPVQTADPDRQAKKVVDLALGANWILPGHKHRLALEISRPIYQNLDGPQLETDWHLTLGWQYAP